MLRKGPEFLAFFTFVLLKLNVGHVKIELYDTISDEYRIIKELTWNDGAEDWIPDDLFTNLEAGLRYQIKVSSTLKPTVFAMSEVFELTWDEPYTRVSLITDQIR